MLCQFLLYRKVTQLYISMYILFHILFHYGLSQFITCCWKFSSLEMRTEASKPAYFKAVRIESKNSFVRY